MFTDYEDELQATCSLVDTFIDQLHDLLEDGYYDQAASLSSKINNMTWVSSSVG